MSNEYVEGITSSDHPEVQWALDLFKPDPDLQQSILSKWSHEIGWVFTGVAGSCLRNIGYGRPLRSGIQVHIAAAIVGLLIAQVEKRREDYVLTKRDAMLRDYIIRHPEDFPEPERKKWGEVFVPWRPIR